MNALSPGTTDDIRVAIESALRTGNSSDSFSGSCELPTHGTSLSYEITYWEYHRMGDVEHGVEVTFRLQDTEELVKADIEVIEEDLTRILNATITYEGRVELEDEGAEYVFIEEAIHSF